MKYNLIPIILLSAMVLLVSGCTTIVYLEGQEKQAWIDLAIPIAENVLIGINNSDYQAYSRDFSQEMRDAVPEARFPETMAQIDTLLGRYTGSYITAEAFEQGEYVSVGFNVQFEKRQGHLRLVFKKADPNHEVYGVWMN